VLSPEESADDRREDDRNENDELQGKESGLSVEENSRSTIQVRSPFRIPSASSKSREHLARYSRKRKRCKGQVNQSGDSIVQVELFTYLMKNQILVNEETRPRHRRLVQSAMTCRMESRTRLVKTPKPRARGERTI